MVGDSEPLLPGRDDPLIPLTDRRTPVLSRIRKRRSKRNNLGLHVGSKVATLTLFSDDEERIKEGREIASNFRKGLALELGVPEEAINEELVNEFAAMFMALDESDIVKESALEDSGSNLDVDMDADIDIDEDVEEEDEPQQKLFSPEED